MLRVSCSLLNRVQNRGTICGLAGLLLCTMLAAISTQPLLGSTAPTTTVLNLSSTAVSVQSPVTLTATVTSAGAGVTPGQVLFCNAGSLYCEDLSILGMAQLTSDGTATVKVILGPGRHGIYAKFKGTQTYASSSSLPAVQTVQVSGGVLPSTASIVHASTSSTFSARIGLGLTPSTAAVSFRDLATNAEIASAALDDTHLGSSLDSAVLYQKNVDALDVAAGDFNNDGVLDLAVANGDSTLGVLLGDAAHPGRFLPVHTYEISGGLICVAVGDFNGDGMLDIVGIDRGANLRILLGDPAHPGQFLRQGEKYPAGSQPTYISVGDFNQDGRPDVVTGSLYGGVSILLSDPAHPAQFLAAQTYSNGREYSGRVRVADFNGDGWLDLAVGNGDTGEPYGITLFLADPAHPGTFFHATNLVDGVIPQEIAVGDYNNDGAADIAVKSGVTMSILLADTAHPGKFLAPEIYYNIPYFSLVTTGDFNGDGALDVAIYYDNPPSGTDILLGDPAHPGKFLQGPDAPASDFTNNRFVIAADLNGDGLTDIVRSHGTPQGSAVAEVLAEVTETAQVPNVDIGSATYAYAYYPGDINYAPSISCEIPLGATSGLFTVSGIAVSNITATTATVTWMSSVPTYGVVNYGPVDPLQDTTAWAGSISTTHSIVLPNLKPNTTYGYEVQSVEYFSGCDHRTVFGSEAQFSTPSQ